MITKFFRSPYGVMSVVLVMYVAKVIAKIGVGTYVSSPMILGDGYHNIADIFEALLIIATVILARRPENEEYPFGRKNAESIMATVIGGGLLCMAAKLGLQAIFGLASWIPGVETRIAAVNPFAHESLLMGRQYFWWVFGVTTSSLALSFIVGRYEIAVGKKTGHDSLIADGKETLSDGMIELATVAGVLGEYLFNEPHIEYLFTLVVAVKMAQTGKEILLRGLDTLLQRSIGKEHESVIRTIAMATHGVVDVAEIKTYRVGPKALVIMKLISRANITTQKLIKHGIVARIVTYLREKEFADGGFFIRFDPPDMTPHRIGYAIFRGPALQQGGHAVTITGTLAAATHLRVCDVVDGEIVRWKDVLLPPTIEARDALMRARRVQELRTDAAATAPASHGF